MKVFLLLPLIFYVCACAHARELVFGGDLLMAQMDAAGVERMVSPFAFEVDCAVFAEACDTIGRADIAERMGVLTGFDDVYMPIFNRLAVAVTNGFSCCMARAFCLPRLNRSSLQFRKRAINDYRTVVTTLFPRKGPERYLQAMMGGAFEDFSLPVDYSDADRYRYFALIALEVKTPLVAAEVKAADFYRVDGSVVTGAVNRAYAGEGKRLVRGEIEYLAFPLADSAWFYCLFPANDTETVAAPTQFDVEYLQEIISAVDFEGESKPITVVLPELLRSVTVSLDAGLAAAKVPLRGIVGIGNDFVPRSIEQHLKFALLAASGEAKGERIDVNRPFLYFIYHPATRTMPLLGYYTGFGQQGAKR